MSTIEKWTVTEKCSLFFLPCLVCTSAFPINSKHDTHGATLHDYGSERVRGGQLNTCPVLL